MTNLDQTEHLVATSYSVGFVVVILIADVIVFLNGVFGNVLLIVVMYKTKVKGFPKLFIGNLALADIMVVISSVPTSALSSVLGWHPEVNLTHCRVIAAILSISYSVSITTLITVSFNRYMKICHPLAFWRIFSSTSRNLAICGGLWGVGVLGNLPIYFPSMTPTNFNSDSHTCIGEGESTSADYINIVMFTFLIVPVIVNGYFNVAIYRCWRNSRKRLQQFDQKKEKMMKKNPGVGSGKHVVSAEGFVRELTAVEVVQDKENPCQTMSTDNEDKKPETHCAAERASVKRKENNAGKSTHSSSTTASNCAPGLRDVEMTARNGTSSSTFSGHIKTASTSSDCSESAALFPISQIATAVGSKFHGTKDLWDMDVVSMVSGYVRTATADSGINSVGLRESVYPDNSNSKSVYPSKSGNDTNTNSDSNDTNIKSDSGNSYHLSSGNIALSTVSINTTKTYNYLYITSRLALWRIVASSKLRKREAAEVALVKSLLVISVALFVLYTPYAAIILLSFFKISAPSEVTVISALLLAVNCAVNWIIYGVMNTLFREAYISTLKSLLFCCRR